MNFQSLTFWVASAKHYNLVNTRSLTSWDRLELSNTVSLYTMVFHHGIVQSIGSWPQVGQPAEQSSVTCFVKRPMGCKGAKCRVFKALFPIYSAVAYRHLFVLSVVFLLVYVYTYFSGGPESILWWAGAMKRWPTWTLCRPADCEVQRHHSIRWTRDNHISRQCKHEQSWR